MIASDQNEITVGEARRGDRIVTLGGIHVATVDFYDHHRHALRCTLKDGSAWSWHESKGLDINRSELPVPFALRGRLDDVRLSAVLRIERK